MNLQEATVGGSRGGTPFRTFIEHIVGYTICINSASNGKDINVLNRNPMGSYKVHKDAVLFPLLNQIEPVLGREGRGGFEDIIDLVKCPRSKGAREGTVLESDSESTEQSLSELVTSVETSTTNEGMSELDEIKVGRSGRGRDELTIVAKEGPGKR